MATGDGCDHEGLGNSSGAKGCWRRGSFSNMDLEHSIPRRSVVKSAIAMSTGQWARGLCGCIPFPTLYRVRYFPSFLSHDDSNVPSFLDSPFSCTNIMKHVTLMLRAYGGFTTGSAHDRVLRTATSHSHLCPPLHFGQDEKSRNQESYGPKLVS